jgi:exonuclease III
MPPVLKTIIVLKISTLNLCFGLPNKKDLVKTMLIKEKILVLCLQETELIYNLDHSLMSFVDFHYESELNTVRSRVGMYVRSGLKYVRRQDLEGIDSHIAVIDVKADKDVRIITLYRPFNPMGTNPRTFFQTQLDILNYAITPNSIVLGDFNLDWNKRDNPFYQLKNYFNDMDVSLSGKSLTQLINFLTWRRTVNNQLKESIIDHLFATNPTSIINVSSSEPLFGNHSLISCETNCSHR